VRIVSPGETVLADHGVYNLDRAMVWLRGRDLRLETERDLVRARDSLEYWERQRVAVARGDAVAVRGDKEIRADVLTAYFRPDAEGRLEMSTVKADGNVRISTPTEFARGAAGVYYVKEQLATLTGAVKITRGESQLNGEYAEVDLESGVSRLLGAAPGQPGDTRVRGLLVPESLDKPGTAP
jgi:lipopolysaccharide export system protein LptA